MKISFDETKIVVSDWLTKKEYKFDDIESLEFSRPTISYHPYRQLEITMTDKGIRKVKFIPRGSDAIKSMFSKELQGRQKELIELWTQRTTANKMLSSIAR